jgi:DNA-directed RNA polymerase subunit RPC12/RpoP/tellurite resistance protein
VFVCSFCAKPISFQPHQLGKRVACPACRRRVTVLPNQTEVIDAQLTTQWYYRKPRLLLGDQELGPIFDSVLLGMLRRGEINGATEVRSPQLMRNQWVHLGQVNVALIQEQVDQRIAEQHRRTKLIERQQQADRENRDKLHRAICSIVADGAVSLGERNSVFQFAERAGIPTAEVQQLLAEESTKIVRAVLDEAVADGILDPHEEQRIGQLATSLGVPLQFDEEMARRIDLCQLAYELDSGTYSPAELSSVPFKPGAKEQVLATCEAIWYEVVSAKRPAGISLGDDRYLKSICAGTAFVTNKQLLVVSNLDSKKVTLSSVQRVTRYSDGVLFNRSSGKSVFLGLDPRSTTGGRFALIAQYAASGEPVLGFDPTDRFIPDVLDVTEVLEFPAIDGYPPVIASAPRYTFRVVGDHVGNRAAFISRLRPGQPLLVFREPHNPADDNAVAIYDQNQNQLGYLKREVAEWFAPMLDRGKRFTCSVHALTSSGSLIAAVFES